MKIKQNMHSCIYEKVIKFSFIDPWDLKDTKGPFQKKVIQT